MADIYTKLDSLANDLSTIPFISSGGCGITALELYKRMPTELQPRILVGGVVESNCRDLAANLRNGTQDRKSTRLNSSHVKISYAVFCLKKKINQNNQNNS